MDSKIAVDRRDLIDLSLQAALELEASLRDVPVEFEAFEALTSQLKSSEITPRSAMPRNSHYFWFLPMYWRAWEIATHQAFDDENSLFRSFSETFGRLSIEDPSSLDPDTKKRFRDFFFSLNTQLLDRAWRASSHERKLRQGTHEF